ncbi:MAG TPA: pyruvate kinase [Ktedonobacterales bacterium]|jgi:pyruvate kinase
MRATKIVCTIGPASRSEEVLERLILAGMNVARLNFSHGTHEEHAEVVARVRRISTKLGRAVAILQDLQGPKIRTGSLLNQRPVVIAPGAPFTLTTEQVVGDASRVSTTYQNLPGDVKAGDHILLADGLLELEVTETTSSDVCCRVIHGGVLGEHKGINLPGVAVSAPALTEKDRDDLRFGVEQQVDFVALSFVRQPSDLDAARQVIAEARASLYEKAAPDVRTIERSSSLGKNGEGVPIIAKLEKPEAITHLDAILEAADGVMVARGDLGVELSPEKVPLLQKRIISRANQLGIPVITATQMLESMVTQPRPTRAEASDVANAILDGTDAVMLSEETASGSYPVEAVEMMVRIARETEPAMHSHPQIQYEEASLARAVSRAAHTLASEASVQAIVVFTRSGASAHLISKERPRVPIFAYTPFDAVYRQLAIWWGVAPRQISIMNSTEKLIAEVSQRLEQEGAIQRGERVVIMGGMPVAGRARTNFIKLHQI